MMKRLQGGFFSSALLLLRGAFLVVAASLAPHTGLAQQSLRLVPSTNRFAGNPLGPASDFGSASSIALNGPTYVVSDASTGNVYISDTSNNCIRRVDTNGNMSVAVGQPSAGGDTCLTAGSVTANYTTGVLQPSGIAVDAHGNLYIADTGHNCIRRLANGATGIAATQPLVDSCTNPPASSMAASPAGVAVDPSGNLYIAINDAADGIFQVVRSSPSNGYATTCLVSGAGTTPALCPGISPTPSVALNAPQGLTLDPIGNLYIADSGNSCVRAVLSGHQSVAVGKCTNDGNGSSSTALQTPVSVATDAAGYLYVTDTAAAMAYELVAGNLTPVAGNGKTAAYTTSQEGEAAVAVALNGAQGLATDKSGNIYLADTGNNIVRILTQGLRFPETLVGSTSNLQNLQFIINAAVNLNVAVGGDYSIQTNTCSGSLPAPTTTIETCQIALYFKPTLPGQRTSGLTLADSTTSPATLYRFGLTGVGQSSEAIFNPGTIKTLASSLASPSAIAIDSAGDVYYAESSSGAISELPSGSTTPVQLIAPGAVATPTALALDAAGNLYIADSTTNSVLRYDTSGSLSPLVSGLDNPVALVVDPLGNVYIAEDGATTVGVLEVYAGGQQSIIAGQGTNAAPTNVLATTAKFVHPSALYLDPTGQLYVADRGAYRVYVIDASGLIYYFAGNGTPTDTAPGSLLGTGLAGVAGLSADAAGDIYIADAATNRIFVAFKSVAQNAPIAVLAGTGTAGPSGDNGPANLAELNNPTAVAVDGAANVYIADNGNSSLRQITYKDPTLDFGVVKPGQTGGPLSTTLWNAGNNVLKPLAPLVLDDPVNFAIDAAGSGCANSIPAGSTCNLSFYATPQAPGSYVGHDILTDNSVNPKQTITLLVTAPPPPQASITSPDVTVVYGDAYTLAATITGNQSTGATGNVTFSISGTDLCPAQALPANGAVSCSPAATLENVGVYTVNVHYTGDSTYPAANSTIKLTVVPRPVTITADNKTRPINTANPPLTGTVVNVVPGQSITATYSTTATISSAAGTYPIVPAYTIGAGTLASNYAITLVNGTLTITSDNPPPTGGNFTLTATPPEQEIDHRGTVNYVVTLTSTSGFTGPIALACSGLPEGASCAFAPASVTLASGATGTSTMTITATADHTNVPTVFGKMSSKPLDHTGGTSPLLAWTMLPLGLGGSAGGLLLSAGGRRRRRRLFLLVPLALLVALGVTGCAGPSNYKIYTVTVTGTATSGGATITQSSTVDFVLAR